jgi:drug/metabolite transporter (DMT)-like permease
MATVATTQLRPSRLRAELTLAFCTLLWGSTFVVVKNSLDHSSVFVFLALRFTLAGICMAAFRPQVFRVLQREEIVPACGLAFSCFVGTRFKLLGCVIQLRLIRDSSQDRAWC